jgi:hypothetical protein
MSEPPGFDDREISRDCRAPRERSGIILREIGRAEPAGSRVTVIPQANHYTGLLSDIFNRDVAAFLATEGVG